MLEIDARINLEEQIKNLSVPLKSTNEVLKLGEKLLIRS